MNTQFIEMVTSSVLTRALATIFLFLFLIAVLGVWAIRTIQGDPIDPIIWGSIITGASICTTIVGINYGVNLQPAKGQPGQATPPKQGGDLVTTPKQ